MTQISASNPCPYPSCKKLKPREHYACIVHWRSIPPRLQRMIHKGWASDLALWNAADEQVKALWAERVSRGN